MSERVVGEGPVGRFKVDVEFVNNFDLAEVERGHLDPTKVRRLTLKGVVDSGAARLALPQSAAKALGLVAKEKVRVRYADRRTAMRDRVENIYLELLGRHRVGFAH